MWINFVEVTSTAFYGILVFIYKNNVTKVNR